MKIAVDRNMPLAPEAFATLGDVVVVDGRSLQNADLKDIEILAIRSTTKVHAALLEDTAVRFVGTATIGTDHMDIPYLEQHGIQWMYSPGCNARSVAEYITAALLHIGITYDQPLTNQTLGIIGVGNVGRLVAKQGVALGMRVLLHDPPRARAEGSATFCKLEELLTQADYISMHVPLSYTGPDATFHMANQAFFEKMKPSACFLNAARGAVVDTNALLDALSTSRLRSAVIDTWEGEPGISQTLLDKVAIGTPHIAGHSFEGKANGTLMVYEAACRFLSKVPSFDPAPFLPAPECPCTTFSTQGSPLKNVHMLVQQAYDIAKDDTRLRERQADPKGFDSLRRNYPIRREFACTTVTGIPDAQQKQQIGALGFHVA